MTALTRGQRARRTIKTATARIVQRGGLRDALVALRRRQAGGRRVVMLGYHRVVADFDDLAQRTMPGLLISQATFRRHLEDAAAAGYEFASMDRAVDVLAGRSEASRDLAVVSFDDGYRDTWRHAFPVLREFGIPAIVYLPSAYVGSERRLPHDRVFALVRRAERDAVDVASLPRAGRALFAEIRTRGREVSDAIDDFFEHIPNDVAAEVIDALERATGSPPAADDGGELLDWAQVREMADAGVAFGTHTAYHTVLTLETPESIDAELRGSKATVERELGRPVQHFAYCNGWYSDEVIAALRRNGFRSAVTTEDLPNRIGENPYALKRKVLWEHALTDADGRYSSALAVAQLDDLFGLLHMTRPVLGRRP